MADPAPPGPAALDLTVIDAARALAVAQLADPRDDDAIAAARAALDAARQASGYAHA